MADVVPVAAGQWRAAYRVHEQSFLPTAADFLSPESFHALAVSPGALLLGLAEGAGKTDLLGYILLRLAGGEAEILSLAVGPPGRGKGGAKALVAAAVASARQMGATTLFLEVNASNTPAIAAYRALGLEPCGVRKGYYRHKTGEIEDALTMKLALVN
jgi:[ribosomal protein S18]-alanine N-acetyltransferase